MSSSSSEAEEQNISSIEVNHISKILKIMNCLEKSRLSWWLIESILLLHSTEGGALLIQKWPHSSDSVAGSCSRVMSCSRWSSGPSKLHLKGSPWWCKCETGLATPTKKAGRSRSMRSKEKQEKSLIVNLCDWQWQFSECFICFLDWTYLKFCKLK